MERFLERDWGRKANNFNISPSGEFFLSFELWDEPPLFGSAGGPETKTACSRSVPCWWRAPRRQTEDVFCVNSDVTSWKKKTHQRSENSRLLKSEFFKKIIQNQISSNFFLPSCLLFQLTVMLCVSFIVHVFFFGTSDIFTGRSLVNLVGRNLPLPHGASILAHFARSRIDLAGDLRKGWNRSDYIFCSKQKGNPQKRCFFG